MSEEKVVIPRYPHFPRLVGIGVQTSLNAVDAHLFKMVVGRNAIIFHASSFATGVVHLALEANAPENGSVCLWIS
jgi:hypothetical protein